MLYRKCLSMKNRKRNGDSATLPLYAVMDPREEVASCAAQPCQKRRNGRMTPRSPQSPPGVPAQPTAGGERPQLGQHSENGQTPASCTCMDKSDPPRRSSWWHDPQPLIRSVGPLLVCLRALPGTSSWASWASGLGKGRRSGFRPSPKGRAGVRTPLIPQPGRVLWLRLGVTRLAEFAAESEGFRAFPMRHRNLRARRTPTLTKATGPELRHRKRGFSGLRLPIIG